MPEGFRGMWIDLQWLGYPSGTALITATPTLQSLLGPIYFSKFLAPISLLLLGLSAWLFCRQTGFSRGVSLVTSLAVMLNMNTVSHVGWGLASRAMCLAAVFLALAALAGISRGRAWLRVILAGLATGVCVLEGFDIGAIYSLYVAAWTFFLALISDPSKPLVRRMRDGAVQTAVVAVFAAFLAWQAVSFLIENVVRPKAGTAQELMRPEDKWNFTTQWSLPKIEVVRLLVPGLFGYGVHTPGDAQYWGTVGQQPGWEQHHQGFPRYSGAGEYAGLLVLLVASWALVFSLQRKDGPFSDYERKGIWFWAAAAFISLLLAFGRHAVFYKFIYALPYFSTIRNPLKFMHPFHLGLLILFAYGLQGLSKRYLEGAVSRTKSLIQSVKQWWAGAPGPDKKWTVGAMVFLAVSLLAGMVYSSSERDLLQYLQANGLGEPAAGIIKFSKTEVVFYLVFLVVSLGALLAVFSGYFRGRSWWALTLLGLILVVDLLRADLPWIIYYDYKEKYTSNIAVDRLREKPYEGRVTEVGQLRKFGGNATQKLFNNLVTTYGGNKAWMRQFEFLMQYYDGAWLQQLFPYYNIQALDLPQEPRPPGDKAAYNSALGGNIGRMWTLTNTRHVVGMADPGFLALLNQEIDPVQRRFRVVMPFELYQDKEGSPIKAQANPNGPFALIEFTGSLPRAGIYSRWEISTNQEATLKTLASAEFNPHETVIIDGDGPPPIPGAASAVQVAEFVSYAPKRIQLRAKAAGPSILLLNDRYDADWKVFVDGKPDRVLRCNYVMRGVALSSGEHTVEFRFEPKAGTLYVSLTAIILGLALLGVVMVLERREPAVETAKPMVSSASRDGAGKKSKI